MSSALGCPTPALAPSHAVAVFGQDWVDASRAGVKKDSYLPEAQDAEAIEVCGGVLDTVIGAGWDTTTLKPLVVPTAQGWSTTSDFFGLQCSVSPVDGLHFDLPGGSLVGIGDTKIERIPIAG